MITHFRQAIEETLPWLSSFGADPTGGMTRLLYSPEWLETQQQFKKRMAASGLETRFDEVGNLYGRLSGTEYPQEVVLSASRMSSGAVKISLGWRILTTCGISVMPKEIVLSMR